LFNDLSYEFKVNDFRSLTNRVIGTFVKNERKKGFAEGEKWELFRCLGNRMTRALGIFFW